jgi:hypothetical protein
VRYSGDELDQRAPSGDIANIKHLTDFSRLGFFILKAFFDYLSTSYPQVIHRQFFSQN